MLSQVEARATCAAHLTTVAALPLVDVGDIRFAGLFLITCRRKSAVADVADAIRQRGAPLSSYCPGLKNLRYRAAGRNIELEGVGLETTKLMFYFDINIPFEIWNREWCRKLKAGPELEPKVRTGIEVVNGIGVESEYRIGIRIKSVSTRCVVGFCDRNSKFYGGSDGGGVWVIEGVGRGESLRASRRNRAEAVTRRDRPRRVTRHHAAACRKPACVIISYVRHPLKLFLYALRLSKCVQSSPRCYVIGRRQMEHVLGLRMKIA
ncbi:hypothetical protein EVAR_4357_1 [Eumeta japonica]|uniref:Uncharacterized protein n=1 Tax=Eumeta variegata TaxID=151549 RepID=A0A4C1SGZ9_EUMVA|nr:hypothetical protein EVAR_4357_1 [Eumeta japonica]